METLIVARQVQFPLVSATTFSRKAGRGRISLFEQSRSDSVMVAVGLSPRNNGRERSASRSDA
jgi:hypothetical protein